MTKKIKILLADDHAIVRDGLAANIALQPDMTVVGEAEDGKSAVKKALVSKPDLVLMDLMMPVMNGTEATEKIRQRLPDTQILILTSFPDSDDIGLALSNGAIGAISKSTPKNQLLESIRAAAAGKRVVSPEVESALNDEEPLPRLSPRQREILDGLVRGLTNKDISRQLGISVAVVKFHLLILFKKLNVSNRSEAVAIALRKHLLKI